MKNRMFFVALMVVVFMLAMVGSAFAAYQNSTYTTWSEASTATAGSSPHAGYLTTTKNCGVCHAVHHATGGTAQLLLNDLVANSCTYCHMTLPSSVTQVYQSNQANYNSDAGLIGIENHSSPLAVCTSCHAVHGANAAWAPAAPYILKLAASYGAGALSPTSTASTSTVMGITAWCTGCHPYYNAGHGGSTHIMATTTANFVGGGNTLPANTTVAWTSSNTCQSCHDAAPGAVGGFPHYSPNAPRFMTHGIVNNAANPTAVNNDGSCIWCHKNGVVAGVGITF